MPPTRTDGPRPETEVEQALRELVDAIFRQDAAAIEARYAPDPDVVLIGSMEGERCVGRDEILEVYERDFLNSGPVQIDFTWLSISARQNVAWVAAECLVHAAPEGEPMEAKARLTAVLERCDDSWLIVQQHFSFPASG